MASRYLIYALVDPRTEELRYVGRSSSGLTRPRTHSWAARRGSRGHVCDWIRTLHTDGLEPEIEVLEELLPGDDIDARLNEAERFWIRRLREEGCHLTNMTAGGEGCHGLRVSDVTRLKLSLTRGKKRWSSWTHEERAQAMCDRLVRFVPRTRSPVLRSDGAVFKSHGEATIAAGVSATFLSLAIDGGRKVGGFFYERLGPKLRRPRKVRPET